MANDPLNNCFQFSTFEDVDNFQIIIDKLREQGKELEKRDEIYDKGTFSIGTLLPLKEKVDAINGEINSIAADLMQARKKLKLAFLTKAINDLDELIRRLDATIEGDKAMAFGNGKSGLLSEQKLSPSEIRAKYHDRYLKNMANKKRAVEEKTRLENIRQNIEN